MKYLCSWRKVGAVKILPEKTVYGKAIWVPRV